MKVVIRADASVEIGVGHVMRCLTLADELRNRGADIYFICRELPGHLGRVIEQKRIKLILIPCENEKYKTNHGDPAHANWLGVPWQVDAEDTIQAIGREIVDWLIVDHYGIDIRWHKLLRAHARKIMAIDDLADRQLDCDLLLDQTYGRQKDDYYSYTPEYCQLLVGSDYALLRPEFARLRPKAMEKRKSYRRIKSILVSMGGMDPDNVTARVLSGLTLVNWREIPIVTVVLNSDAPNLQEVIKQAENHELEVSVQMDVSNMAELMLEADIAVGAVGSTTWERCCLGLPTLSVVTAKNQVLSSRLLGQAGVIIDLGDSSMCANAIKNSITMILSNISVLERMIAKSFSVTDGNGTQIAASYLLA